ncbi:MAG: hybrid sensor histidine kinase/response regulator [bacterium]|nr:hybrid sensor histidine kinase/response regulator [bacterium]
MKGKPKILIVDDREENLISVEKILVNLEADLIRAESGARALEKVLDNEFALALIDVQMPDMDGYETVILMRQDERTAHMPVIFLSAVYSDDYYQLKGIETGAVDFMTKPVVPEILIGKVKVFLDMYKQKERLYKANKELREKLILSEKMAALGKLVSGAAHEINTPLGIGITALSDLAGKNEEIDRMFRNNEVKRSDLEQYLASADETCAIALSNLGRAVDLVKSLKVVAVDQCSEEKRKFFVKEYFDDILLSLRPVLKKTKHTVTLSCSGAIQLVSYPGALSQIITNMIMNSLIHGFDEIESGEILIEIDQADNHVVIRYGDNGKGIPEEDIPVLFDKYYTTRRGEGGSGLGMYIIHDLTTRLLGGTIEYLPGDSGAAFAITIP